ncbi:MAG: Carboxynorspermidine/carboxyspermidine decarboxylase [Syntrophorhabdus sp. PtaU1.Bin153]|nr:MAG: Carboxynorspermidine/carboxyspermidine decarboxylase [Syntrophorhabdus sp. PtaU1.Bin153]
MMVPDEPVQNTIEAICAKGPSAADLYHALPGDGRKKVLGMLDTKQVRSLTALIKAAKKKRFAAANKRFLEIASGPILRSTPVYLIDETLIEENMRILQYVKDRTGCKILHALKAYASFATFSTMNRYLDGTCASGLNEARLGSEEFKKEVHTFGAAYRKEEIDRILAYSDSIIFNSFYQLQAYGKKARGKGVEIGLRVNPGHAEVETEMYNPCAPCSRLGIPHDGFRDEFLRHRDMVDGLHFHAMCEQNSDVLERILTSFEKLYGPYLEGLKWVNFGGGHHVTRDDYDIERLVRLIDNFKKRYGVQVYLEPGEASVLNAGVLISSVLDIVKNEMEIAIIDASAEAHMPDVLIMPYRPNIMKSGKPNEKPYTFRIAGPSCLAGDVAGNYSFDQPLRRGDRLVFTDMALYSIVKNTTFNGITLPDIAVVKGAGTVETVKRFGYKYYKDRQS